MRGYNHATMADQEHEVLTGDGRRTSPVPKLLPHHWDHLSQSSGLTAETLIANGIYSETDIRKVNVLLGRSSLPRKSLPAIAFPYNGNGYTRLRPDFPRKDRKGKPQKYEAPSSERNRPYIPAGVEAHFDDTKQELAFTEGEKKALKLTQDLIPTIGLSGVYAWCEKGKEKLLRELEGIAWHGRIVYLIFDSDASSNDKVLAAETRFAARLKALGAIVKIVRLPPGPNGEKLGADDYLVANHCGELRKLMDAATEPQEIDAGSQKQHGKSADPADEAAAFLQSIAFDGACRLIFWRGSFWYWHAGRFVEMQNTEVRANVVRHLNEFYYQVCPSVVSGLMEQVRAQSLLPSPNFPPCWIVAPDDDVKAWQTEDLLVAKNGIVHLPSYVAASARYIVPASPRLFSTTALDYPLDINAPHPERWHAFLKQIWDNDQQSIGTLQEYMGYLLTPDTRLQKMLLVIGPARSGKGTIARIIREVVGRENVAGPTLASLSTNFGLWPLLGKTVAVISDARLSGRSDQAAIVERLLSISGEDSLTIDRKNLEPLTTKLTARFVVISNELPQLSDSSGALTNRMIILRMMRSFLGKEDTRLTDKLLEEKPGILAWAIEGWRRLRERGYFNQPDAGKELKDQLEDIASPIGAFIRERCEVGPGYRAAVDDIYAEWKSWCDQNGREPGTVQTFGRHLVASANLQIVRPREDGTRYRAYEGIRLLVRVGF
jgi:putative DNA primase/helicase